MTGPAVSLSKNSLVVGTHIIPTPSLTENWLCASQHVLIRGIFHAVNEIKEFLGRMLCGLCHRPSLDILEADHELAACYL
jgi:hypothetical protein